MRNIPHAVMWMLFTGILAVIITVIAKSFGTYFHPFQVMFLYCSIGTLCLLPATVVYFACHKESITLASIRWRHHILRSVLEFTAFSMTFYSIMVLPLPLQSMLMYTTPIFTSILAVIFLGEVINRYVLFSLLLGIIGICIAHNPFALDVSSAATLGIMSALGAAMVFGVCASLIKLSTRTTPPMLIAFIMLVLTSLVSAPFAISVWRTPQPEHFLSLLGFGIAVATVQFAVAKAFSMAALTRLIPLSYLNLVWASLFAYFLFDELIETRTIIGSVFIFSAVFFVSMGGKKKTING